MCARLTNRRHNNYKRTDESENKKTFSNLDLFDKKSASLNVTRAKNLKIFRPAAQDARWQKSEGICFKKGIFSGFSGVLVHNSSGAEGAENFWGQNQPKSVRRGVVWESLAIKSVVSRIFSK